MAFVWAVSFLAVPWVFVASVFFLLAAIYSDLLLIRLALAIAYSCLIVNLLVSGLATSTFVVDAWLVTGLTWLIHIVCTIKMMWDDRAVVRFPHGDDQLCVNEASSAAAAALSPAERDEIAEATWRFFERRGGMRRLAFAEVWRSATVHAVAIPRTGAAVVCDAQTARRRLFLVVRGVVDLDVSLRGVSARSVARSGDFFDFALWNVFGVNVGFISDGLTATVRRRQGEAKSLNAVSDANSAVLVSWPLDALDAMARGEYAAVADGWRSIALYSIAAGHMRAHGAIAETISLAPGEGGAGASDARAAAVSRTRSPSVEDQISRLALAIAEGASSDGMGVVSNVVETPSAEGGAPPPAAVVAVRPAQLARMPTPQVWDSGGTCERVEWTMGARSRDFNEWSEVELRAHVNEGVDLGGKYCLRWSPRNGLADCSSLSAHVRRLVRWVLMSHAPIPPKGVRHRMKAGGGWLRQVVLERAAAAAAERSALDEDAAVAAEGAAVVVAAAAVERKE